MDDAPIARDDGAHLDFDGIDDYVAIADDPILRMTNALTMEAWFRPESLSATDYLLVINKEGEYEVGISPTGEIAWGLANTDPGWTWHDTGYAVNLNEWHHVAVAYDNGTVNTYVNGNLVDTYFGSGSIGDQHPALNELRIGGRQNNPSGKFFDGQIEEVRIWNSARTQAEVQANLDARLTGAEIGLAGSWTFFDGSGTVASDQTAAGNDGILTDGGAGTAGPQWTEYSVSANSSFITTVADGPLANDLSVDGDSLTVTSVNNTSTLGTVTMNPGGELTYDPNGAFDSLVNGQVAYDTVIYTAEDSTGNQDTATVSIRIVGINDPPVITSAVGGGTHNEGTTGTFFNNSLTITDADSADLDGGTLTTVITNNGESTDRLTIRDGSNVTTSGTDVLYDFGGGPVAIGTFSGGDSGSNPLLINFNTASTVASVEAVAQQVAFRSVSDNPSTLPRTLEMNVTDGDIGGTSNTVVRSMNVVAVNDPPTLTTFGSSVDTTLEDTEVELTFAEFVAAGDEADADGTVDGFVVQSISSGALRLGNSVGTATAFAAGTNDTINATTNAYWTPALNAEGTLAAFEVVALDNDTAESAPNVAVAVTVTGTNDDPVITANTLTIQEGESVSLTGMLAATDIETADASLVFTVSGVSGGQFERTSTPQLAITTFNQSEIIAGDIVFVHDGGEIAPTYDISVSDGTANTVPTAATIVFTALNDAPVLDYLAGDATVVVDDGTPVAIDAGTPVVLKDAESPTDYDGATLTFNGFGFDAVDALSIDTSGAVALSGVADGSAISVGGTVVGTISGYSASGVNVLFNVNAEKSDVEAIIGAMQFSSTSAVIGSRTVEVVFNDNDGGTETSPTATVFLSVSPAGSGFVSTDEDTTYSFTAADFEFTGTAAVDIDSITITALPANGVLTLNTSNVAINQVVTRAEIDAGLLRFSSLPDEFGGAYTSFDFAMNGGNKSVTILAGEPNLFTLNGGQLTPTDEILADPAHFGPTGTVASSVTIGPPNGNIDATYLNSGQILFHGFVPDANVTSDELDAIQTWVQGGGILISTSDSPSFDAISDRYGLRVTTTTNPVWNDVTSGTHEIMNGPFGLVGGPITATGAISYFSSGITGADVILARDSVTNQPTMLIRQDGNGLILFTSDEGIFRAGVSNDGVINTDNERLIGNIFAWAIGQIPPSATETITVGVAPMADTPSITPATTSEDTQTTTGLVVSRNPVDGAEVTHYQIRNISGGMLFRNDGITAINNNDFITHAEASSGLRFTPALDSIAPGSFDLQASVSGDVSGLGGSTVAAAITVTEVNDLPGRTAGVVNNLVVNEDSGLTSLGLGSLSYNRGGGADENTQTLTYTVTAVPPSTLGDIVLADGTTVVSASTTYSLPQIQGMQFRTAPNANGGPVTFGFDVTDDGTTNGAAAPLTLSESLTIAINAVNDNPNVDAPIGSINVNEDAADTTIDLTTVFGDVDIATNADSLNFSITSNSNTTVVDATVSGNTLSLDYQPDQNGNAFIVIRATDGAGLFIEDTVSLTVNPLNDNPTVDAPIGSINVNEDAADTTIDLTTVFGDVDIATNADSLNFSITSNSNTTVVDATVSGNTLTLDYQPDQNGNAFIVIRATDGAGLFIEDTVSLTVNPLNDNPTVDAPIGSINVNEDAADTTIDLTTVFGDVDIATNADTLNFSVTSNSNTTVVDATVSGNTLTLDYQPDQNGNAFIVIRATDGAGLFIEDTVSLTVNPIADAPTIVVSLGNVVVNEDAADSTFDLSTIFDDVDIATNGDSLTFTVQSNDNPTLVTASIAGDTLSLDYQPDQNGIATVVVRATDTTIPTGQFVEETVLIDVNAVNDAPVVTGGGLTIDENSPFGTSAGTVSATDVDAGDSASFSIIGETVAGTFAVDAVSGQITVSNPMGLDFEVTPIHVVDIEARDTGGLTDTTTVFVSLLNVNESPVINAPAVQAFNENSTLILSASGGNGIVIADQDAGIVEVTLTAVNGTLNLGVTAGLAFSFGDGLADATMTFEGTLANVNAALEGLQFVPTPDYFGPASLEVLVDDLGNSGSGGPLTTTHTIVLDVIDTNRTPGATDDGLFELVQTGTSADAPGVLGNDTDADGDPLTAVLITDVANGVLTLNADGSFSYIPNAGFEGIDQFQYAAFDGERLSAPATVSLLVELAAPPLPPNDDGTDGEPSDPSDSGTTDETDEEPPTTTSIDADPPVATRTSSSNRPPRSVLQRDFGSTDDPDLNGVLATTATVVDAQFASVSAEGLQRALPSRAISLSSISESVLTLAYSQNGESGELIQWENNFSTHQLMIGSTAIVSTSLTVGYVIWLLRGGALLASLVSSIPAWCSFDPLPIVETFEDARTDERHRRTESLSSIVTRGSRPAES